VCRWGLVTGCCNVNYRQQHSSRKPCLSNHQCRASKYPLGMLQCSSMLCHCDGVSNIEFWKSNYLGIRGDEAWMLRFGSRAQGSNGILADSTIGTGMYFTPGCTPRARPRNDDLLSRETASTDPVVAPSWACTAWDHRLVAEKYIHWTFRTC
jgi:hypothetical protein